MQGFLPQEQDSPKKVNGIAGPMVLGSDSQYQNIEPNGMIMAVNQQLRPLNRRQAPTPENIKPVVNDTPNTGRFGDWRQVVGNIMLGAGRAIDPNSSTPSVDAVIGGVEGLQGKRRFDMMKPQMQQAGVPVNYYNPLLGGNVNKYDPIQWAQFNRQMENDRINQAYKQAQTNWYNRRLDNASGMFGESNNAFLKAMDFMNTPEFQNLPLGQQNLMMDWMGNQAKNPNSLYNQKFAEGQGRNMADIQTGGQASYNVQSGKERATLGYAQPIEEAKVIGRKSGEDFDNYTSQTSKLPQLEQAIKKLSDLAPVATYTIPGQLADQAKRQLGLPVGDGAVARTEYEAVINNQILPLLRDTFGAQFTEREGESLRATLGDVNKSPEEKMAVLNTFIEQKKRNIQSQANKVNLMNGNQLPQVPQETNKSFDDIWNDI